MRKLKLATGEIIEGEQLRNPADKLESISQNYDPGRNIPIRSQSFEWSSWSLGHGEAEKALPASFCPSPGPENCGGRKHLFF